MGVIDLVTRVVSGPAGRVVEAPVRDLVDEVIRQSNLASPQEVQAVRAEVSKLTAELHGLRNQLTQLTEAVSGLQAQLQAVDTRAGERAQGVEETAGQAIALAKEAEATASGAAARAEQAISGLDALTSRSDALEAQLQGHAHEAPAAEAPAAEAPAAEAAEPVVEAPAQAPEAPSVAAPVIAPPPDEDEDDDTKPGRRSLTHLGCKVDGCVRDHRSKGFCSRHYQRWRRGTLEGYVGPKGLVEIDGVTLQVDEAYEGDAVEGSSVTPKRATLTIGGVSVKANRLPA